MDEPLFERGDGAVHGRVEGDVVSLGEGEEHLGLKRALNMDMVLALQDEGGQRCSEQRFGVRAPWAELAGSR